MAKPEWGTKRECQGCGTHFYDLKRDPIVCPKCETAYVIEVPKPKPAAERKVQPKKKAPPAAAAVVKEEPKGGDTEALAAEDDDDSEDESFVEDASELEGGDDVGLGIETDIKNGEGER